MSNGKIKWFNPTKGYGFIENDAGGKDVFLHVSALEQAGIDTLEEGEAVSFEIGDNRGKENAINITKILLLYKFPHLILIQCICFYNAHKCFH